MRLFVLLAVTAWLHPPERWSLTYALLLDHHLLQHLLGEAHGGYEDGHDHGDLPWHHHHSAQCESTASQVVVTEVVRSPMAPGMAVVCIGIPAMTWWPNDPGSSVWRPPRA